MIPHQIPWLSIIILFPLVASLAIPLIPDQKGRNVRWYALGVGITDLVLMVYAFWRNYDLQNSTYQLVESYPWVPQLGLNWSVAVDGLSMPLVLMTGLITTLAILAAWNVTNKPRLFYFLMLVMYSAQIGVFTAQDMLLFFLMWEIELVPVYLLISIWGGQKRRYAATKFIIYTAAASIFILVGGLAMAFYGDTLTFDMAALASKNYPKAFELLVYVGFLIAFGVKLPIFPLHTWLPDAHSEAPAPASMILAGVLLKMGGYALIRMNIEMLPNAHIYFAPVLAVLGVVNIIYGAFAAFAQTNLKRRLAYSSIAHMGFVLIGIASFTEIGISHTLVMEKMGGMAKAMPRVFALFTAGSMASLALPGMSGFVGELSIFLGITTSDAYSSVFKCAIAFLAAVGVILTPIYLLSMLREVFYGVENSGLVIENYLGDAKPREMFIALCLLVPIIGIGLYPKLMTQTYDVKTVAVATQARNALSIVVAQKQGSPLYSGVLLAPQLAITSSRTLVSAE